MIHQSFSTIIIGGYLLICVQISGLLLMKTCLFYSEDIFSANWIPHPMNPVVSDVEVARGAGKIFISNNKIFRPSQNNVRRYGYGVNINEIEELNTKSYKKRKISGN